MRPHLLCLFVFLSESLIPKYSWMATFASRHHNKAVYNIPSSKVCGLMGPFWSCFVFWKVGFGKTGNLPYKWRNRDVFLGHAHAYVVFVPSDCLAAKGSTPLNAN